MVETTEMPEEIAGEAPADPSIMGHLDPQELSKLSALRHRGTQITLEIGNIEVRKARLLGALQEAEKEAQRVLNEAAKRMSIPDGQLYQVASDGVVRLSPAGGPA